MFLFLFLFFSQYYCAGDDDNDGDDNDGDVDDGDDDDGDDDGDQPHSLLLLSGHSGSGLPLGFHHDLSFLHSPATTARETSLLCWIHLLSTHRR